MFYLNHMGYKEPWEEQGEAPEWQFYLNHMGYKEQEFNDVKDGIRVLFEPYGI